jgi:phage-related protein
MNTFPVLKTGAVMQYPAERDVRFSTQVVRFVDGSEQRFRQFGRPLQRWVIRLDKLDEYEMNTLREFFRIQNGAAGAFQFTDPWDETVYPNCSLQTDQMIETFQGPFEASTSLIVRENRT